MLIRINSSYVLKQIMDNIDIKRNLNLVKYSKKLQKRLDLDIFDYKRFSGTYIIEENGYITEYNGGNDYIIYEGGFSNGKRNGKGKEFNKEYKLIFEGEYSEGQKWKGYIKEYNDNGKLIFEGDYLCGINGKGKEYDNINGELLFEGEYLNGKRNGNGSEYKYVPKEKPNYFYNENSYYRNENFILKRITLFEGEYLNGERKKGKEYNYDEKLVYQGEYLNGKKHGKGKEYNNDGSLKYEGEYLNGQRHGKGAEFDNYNNYKFEGEYLEGKKMEKEKNTIV